MSCSFDEPPIGDSAVRYDSIHQMALKFGAQSGLAWQSDNISSILSAHRKRLASVYDFRGLLIDAHILPPILQETRQDINLDASENMMRISDMTVEMIQEAKFVTTAPLWHEYVQLGHSAPMLPQVSLLPQNVEERDIWDKSVLDGWLMGVEQANDIFMSGIYRLNRDFTGIVLFHRFYEQGLVSRPYASTTEMGVTGDERKVVVGDQVVRMSQQARLLTQESDTWDPLLVKAVNSDFLEES